MVAAALYSVRRSAEASGTLEICIDASAARSHDGGALALTILRGVGNPLAPARGPLLRRGLRGAPLAAAPDARPPRTKIALALGTVASTEALLLGIDVHLCAPQVQLSTLISGSGPAAAVIGRTDKSGEMARRPTAQTWAVRRDTTTIAIIVIADVSARAEKIARITMSAVCSLCGGRIAGLIIAPIRVDAAPRVVSLPIYP